MTQIEWSDLGVSGLPTGTVTLLLADVEGSTRQSQTQPDEMTAAVARLDNTLTETVAAHNGVRPVEQGEGDSFVVAFARASDAVACALICSGHHWLRSVRELGSILGKFSFATKVTTSGRP